MNISASGPMSGSLNMAVRDAIADGIVVVVAAGNNNADACVYSPGSEPGAITVGATDSADAKLGISNYGKCVDVYAPGAWITSAWHTGAADYRTLKGTSFASPHVAGIAALVLEANPTYTPAQVASAIVSSATPNVITGLSTTSTNLLAYAPYAVAPTPVTTTTVAQETTTTSTTIAVAVEKVSARKVGRGYYEVRVSGVSPNLNFAVQALDKTRRPAKSISWLTTADSSGNAVFYVHWELSGFQFSIVK